MDPYEAYNQTETKEMNEFSQTPKSAVKLVKNTKGLNWEIKVVQGEAHLLEELMRTAVNIHKALEMEFIPK